MRYFASISFGKDSLAMLMIIIEKGLPLDEVVFYDTGVEFQAIYNTRDKILPLLKEKGIKYTELYPDVPFLEKMLNKKVVKRNGSGEHFGYSWCGATCRWGTTDKIKALRSYMGNSYDYVGIAADEIDRINKGKRKNRILPLVELGITEKKALEYCYSKEFDWSENGVRLYDILDRVSCWCCANKNNYELLGIYEKLPEYFEKLKDLENKNRLNFRVGKNESIFDIEKKIQNKTLRFIKKATHHVKTH